MRTLADLFDDDRRSAGDIAPRPDRESERRRMSDLVGPPRAPRRVGTPRDDTSDLVAYVDRAARSASEVRAMWAPATVKVPRRGTKRTDWLNAGVAIAAVIIVGAVAVYGGVQLADARPAESALQALTADEASLVNGEQAVRSGAERIETLIDEARTRADAVRPALVALEDYVDEGLRRQALDAVATLRAELDEIEVPVAPEAYERPDIDTEDLGAVGAQIDAVRERNDRLSALTAEVRDARADVVALTESFREPIVALGSSLTEVAESEILENIQADQVIIDEVRANAAEVVRQQEAGRLGVDAMLAFPGLVDELRDDHARVVAAIIAEQEAQAAREQAAREQAEREAWERQNGGGAVIPGPADPVEPEPEEPPATDPPATPPPTDSEPTDPPEDGGSNAGIS